MVLNISPVLTLQIVWGHLFYILWILGVWDNEAKNTYMILRNVAFSLDNVVTHTRCNRCTLVFDC
jgi:hypothetical protein